MKKRPIAVTVIAIVYIVVGVLSMGSHLMQPRPLDYDVVWPVLINIIAIISGVYLLRRSNWARWLAVAWIAFHVVLSYFHSWPEVMVHALFCAAIAYFLYRPEVTRYFRSPMPSSV